MTDTAVESSDASEELLRLLQLPDRREPAVVDIALWIARGIIQGDLTPGQPLNSVDLASRFGTSRTPVREALAILESDGLVEMRARKRPRVTIFDQDRIKEIFFLRAHLMSALSQVAVEKATDEDLATLSALVESLRTFAIMADDDHYRWAHFRFFDAIVVISQNATARVILNSLFLRTLSVRRALANADRLSESLHYAEQILDAFQRADAQLASLLVRRSVEAAIRSIDHT